LASVEKYSLATPRDIEFFAKWVKNPRKVFAGFTDGRSRLSATMMRELDNFVSDNSELKFITCIGFTEGPTILPADSRLARARGIAACGYLQRRHQNLVVRVITGTNLRQESRANRSVLVQLSK
jgi:hypothetical protein